MPTLHNSPPRSGNNVGGRRPCPLKVEGQGAENPGAAGWLLALRACVTAPGRSQFAILLPRHIKAIDSQLVVRERARDVHYSCYVRSTACDTLRDGAEALATAVSVTVPGRLRAAGNRHTTTSRSPGLLQPRLAGHNSGLSFSIASEAAPILPPAPAAGPT
ncbi:hypothetical protein HaLaN_32144 [Haematococcus lacustris]|uniref:Uncharacterized protein n=1 Tax=Haematococcus lacustris TaxID=44745 RepID=A0A6A0AJA5_HAELA|nr:hypothetical protein HaLaN_32144 [Haematococcus lacustris]